jgi:hypothetical protein
MKIKSRFRRWKKRNNLKWLKRYEHLQKRYWRIAYSDKMSLEWCVNRRLLLTKLLILKAYDII